MTLENRIGKIARVQIQVLNNYCDFGFIGRVREEEGERERESLTEKQLLMCVWRGDC